MYKRIFPNVVKIECIVEHQDELPAARILVLMREAIVKCLIPNNKIIIIADNCPKMDLRLASGSTIYSSTANIQRVYDMATNIKVTHRANDTFDLIDSALKHLSGEKTDGIEYLTGKPETSLEDILQAIKDFDTVAQDNQKKYIKRILANLLLKLQLLENDKSLIAGLEIDMTEALSINQVTRVLEQVSEILEPNRLVLKPYDHNYILAYQVPLF